MPRKAVNTERGSRFVHAKTVRAGVWRSVLSSHLLTPSLPLSHLARAANFTARAAQKRWKKFEAARAAGGSEQEALDAAAADDRGGHNSAFNSSQCSLLREQVLALPVASREAVRTAALQLDQGIRLAPHPLQSQQLRSEPRPTFSASSGFLSRFVRQQRLSFVRVKPFQVGKRAASKQIDTDTLSLDYVLSGQDALLRYGPSMLLNMDETPSKVVDTPRCTLQPTGTKATAKFTTTAKEKMVITTLPTITAAGAKLQLCAVIRGKTDKTLNKVRMGASSVVNRVRLYYSESGWVTEAIMLRWVKEIIQPYTHSAPAALILDDYAAHWTPSVLAAASAINLELIRVPKFSGATAMLQPLDVEFNGPMSIQRKKIWQQMKMSNPDAVDSEQSCIERAQQAYEALTAQQTAKAFSKAHIEL